MSPHGVTWPQSLNILRPRQNGRHFVDNIFKCIFLNENVSIAIKILLKFVLKGQINNIPALVQIMAWRRPGDKPLSEPMMISLPTHICVTWPQWVKIIGTAPHFTESAKLSAVSDFKLYEIQASRACNFIKFQARLESSRPHKSLCQQNCYQRIKNSTFLTMWTKLQRASWIW